MEANSVSRSKGEKEILSISTIPEDPLVYRVSHLLLLRLFRVGNLDFLLLVVFLIGLGNPAEESELFRGNVFRGGMDLGRELLSPIQECEKVVTA